MSKLINERFDTSKTPIQDRYSERLFQFIPVSKDYMKMQYKAGFLHPYAYDEESKNAIVECYDYPTLEIRIMDEKTVLKNMLPLLFALKEIGLQLHQPYGCLHPNEILETPNGFYLNSLGIGKEQNEEKRNEYSAHEYYAFHGQGCLQSDVYSVCAIIYELISGEKVPNPLEREANEIFIEPLLAFGTSESFSNCIDKGLSIYPDDRHSSIEELLEVLYSEKELQDFQSDFDILARSVRKKEEKVEDKIKKENYQKEKERKKMEEEHQEEVDEEEELYYDNSSKNKKLFLVFGSVAIVIIALVVISSMNTEPEEEVRTIQGDVVSVSGTSIDYTEDTPTPTVTPLVETMNVEESTSSPTSTPIFTVTPTIQPTIEPTIQPTKKPKSTPKPTKKPVATKKPKTTPKPTKKPKPVTTLPPSTSNQINKPTNPSKPNKPSNHTTPKIKIDVDKITINK